MAKIIERIRVAREQDYQLRLQLYCEGPGCPVRQVDVRIKDYDHELLALVPKLACPLCRKRSLSLHAVLTSEADAEEEAQHARGNVAVQMWERDRGPFIPVSVLLDDRLPPTPDRWWE